MPVTNLSQMMNPGVVGTTGDCATCGQSGFPPTVTRVAIENMAKLNTPVSKAVEPPAPIAQPVQALEVAKALAVAVGIEEEVTKNKGGRPRIERADVSNPNIPSYENPPAPPEKKPNLPTPNKPEEK